MAFAALRRLVSGTPMVDGLPVLIVSAIAAVVMLVGALVLGGDPDDDDGGKNAGEDLNMKAVLLDAAAAGSMGADRPRAITRALRSGCVGNGRIKPAVVWTGSSAGDLRAQLGPSGAAAVPAGSWPLLGVGGCGDTFAAPGVAVLCRANDQDRQLKAALRAPRMSAFAERFVRAVRTECSYRMLVAGLVRRAASVAMPGLELIVGAGRFSGGEGRLRLATVLDLCRAFERSTYLVAMAVSRRHGLGDAAES
jgi:hypothetical protein